MMQSNPWLGEAFGLYFTLAAVVLSLITFAL